MAAAAGWLSLLAILTVAMGLGHLDDLEGESAMQKYNKAIVAAVGFLAYLLAQFGVDLPAEQQQNIVTVIVALVPALVYAVPNRS